MHIVPWKHSRIFITILTLFVHKNWLHLCVTLTWMNTSLWSHFPPSYQTPRNELIFNVHGETCNECPFFLQHMIFHKVIFYFHFRAAGANIFHFEFYLEQILILLITSTTKLYILNVKTTLLHLEILQKLAKILGGSKSHIFIYNACLALNVRVKHSSARCY